MFFEFISTAVAFAFIVIATRYLTMMTDAVMDVEDMTLEIRFARESCATPVKEAGYCFGWYVSSHSAHNTVGRGFLTERIQSDDIGPVKAKARSKPKSSISVGIVWITVILEDSGWIETCCDLVFKGLTTLVCGIAARKTNMTKGHTFAGPSVI